MSRRSLIALRRTILSLLVVAAMGSSRIVAFADEPATTEVSVEEPAQPVYEDGEQLQEDEASNVQSELLTDSKLIIGDKSLVTDDTKGEVSLDYRVEDVCFFIRSGIDKEIPYEPAGHPTTVYSEAIRVNGAIKRGIVDYDSAIYSPDYEETEENLLGDHYTISNNVTDNLLALPSIEEIQAVDSEFDPEKHYIVWYVIKRTSTSYPNGDVYIHVDGVIRTRANTKYKPFDPGESNVEAPSAQTVSSDYLFNIYTTDLENEEPFEYDGKEHLIGGYIIEVLDKENGQLLEEFKYGAFGNRLAQKKGMLLGSARSTEPVGTIFEFEGKGYRVNVDSAYLTVTEPGQYNIPFMFGGQIISSDQIVIMDENGQLIDTGISKDPGKNQEVRQGPSEVKKRSITVTAGSTVQNDDGNTLTNSKVDITAGSLLEGHQLRTTILGSQTGPGTSLNEITDYDIVDANGKSVKDYYDVHLEKGKLVVVAVPERGGKNTNSTGSAVTKVLVKDGEKTVVQNIPVVLGASRDGEDGSSDTANNDGSGKVLGARRADTSDSTMGAGTRLTLIILCIMMIMIINVKRNKTE